MSLCDVMHNPEYISEGLRVGKHKIIKFYFYCMNTNPYKAELQGLDAGCNIARGIVDNLLISPLVHPRKYRVQHNKLVIHVMHLSIVNLHNRMAGVGSWHIVSVSTGVTT